MYARQKLKAKLQTSLIFTSLHAPNCCSLKITSAGECSPTSTPQRSQTGSLRLGSVLHFEDPQSEGSGLLLFLLLPPLGKRPGAQQVESWPRMQQSRFCNLLSLRKMQTHSFCSPEGLPSHQPAVVLCTCCTPTQTSTSHAVPGYIACSTAT